MKKFLITPLYVCSIIAGCSKDHDNNPATTLNTTVPLTYSTIDGKDLLDPQTPNYINYDNIDLYYKTGNEEIRQFHGNLSLSKMFSIGKDSKGKYWLDVFINSNVENGQLSTNILKYKNFRADTIEARIVKHGYNTSYRDLTINGKPVSNEELQDLVLVKE